MYRGYVLHLTLIVPIEIKTESTRKLSNYAPNLLSAKQWWPA